MAGCGDGGPTDPSILQYHFLKAGGAF
jgi:hypothetical protein